MADKDIKDSEYVRSLSEKRKESPQEFETQKTMYDSAVKYDADKSQPGTMEMLKNLGKSIIGKKKGGFVDNAEQVKKHSAGFKHHKDHVKSMCGGGKTKR